jgi:23S rRNA pseudouridine1911/1915/1917 synthase
LANRLLHRFPEIAVVGGPGRPGIVHRLDKDTTGVVAVARSARAYRQLSTAFAQREIQKTYLAIVYGEPKNMEGGIDLPIGRHPTERKKMAVVAGGRPALTLYRVLAVSAGLAFLELDLQTGRTHQIRVHLKAIGHPLVGDPVYGEARWRGRPRMGRKQLEGFPRPGLHAWKLQFEHPGNGRQVSFEAPIPADMQTLWQAATRAEWPLPPAD